MFFVHACADDKRWESWSRGLGIAPVEGDSAEGLLPGREKRTSCSQMVRQLPAGQSEELAGQETLPLS